LLSSLFPAFQGGRPLTQTLGSDSPPRPLLRFFGDSPIEFEDLRFQRRSGSSSRLRR